MNTTENNKKGTGGRFFKSVSFKLFVIVSLSLLMLIPTIFIRNLIDERQGRRNETIYEVTSKWGQEQQLFGPLLIIPYETIELNSDGRYGRYRHYFHVLPDELVVKGKLDPEVRYRGIYEVITYSSMLQVNGNFNSGSFSDWPDNPEKILWNEAKLVMGISDLTGLDAIMNLTWNEQSLSAEGGIPYNSSVSSGVYVPVKIDREGVNKFDIQLSLNGSESIRFVPAGKVTSVELSSEWPDPSFIGASLPDEREVTEDGFTARWESMHLTRSFPQKWSDRKYEYEISESDFGVNLLIPVDIYQKSTRSVKYALLFIGLTFLVIFFIEMMSKQRIHPVQYLLTGFALIVFYSLLLALSEHLNFAYAYLISSASIVAIIGGYANSIFSHRRFAIITIVVLISLYAFLYTILQMSDFALLLGNIGLVLIIAVVMFFSRKIEWYNESNL
jgi:inner membrane protein